jgi:2-oxoglutarate dehydrogenase E1 component
MAASVETVLSGTNLTFVAEVYARYLTDPHSVDPSWAEFFSEFGDDTNSLLKEMQGASWNCSESSVVGVDSPQESQIQPDSVPTGSIQHSPVARAATMQSIRALMMIRAYRVRGHLIARFDPLGLEGNDSHSELDYRSYGFTDADMDQQIFIDHVLGLEFATLRQILQILKDTYCGTIGVEFMHIQEPDQIPTFNVCWGRPKNWLPRKRSNG